jgi:chorismate synthase
MHEDDGGLVTTGTPVSMLIENTDQRSKDYSEIAKRYRPGHADYTYDREIWRARLSRRRPLVGSRNRRARCRGRAGAAGRSGRDCARGAGADRRTQDQPQQLGLDGSRQQSRSSAPDPQTVPVWEEYLDAIRKAGSSVGAVIEVVAENVPAGLGAPIYAKLDQDICRQPDVDQRGQGRRDRQRFRSCAYQRRGQTPTRCASAPMASPIFLSNNAGGILGGISTGQPVVARFAVKPTSSILNDRRSIDSDGNEVDVRTKGRHDPCVGIRAVPIGEAMVACALADHYLRDRGQTGRLD